MSDTKQQDFEEAVRPLMEYLAKNHHPHTTVLVDNTCAELTEGVIIFNTEDYIKP